MSATTQTPASETRLFGLLLEFEDPNVMVAACRQVRDAGYTKWDAHTPFPIHGMDDAMGLRGTRLPLLILGGGLTGFCLALLMQWWMNAVDYPLVISGKPLFGLPAAIPVTFELTILFSALTTFFGMWGLNGMPRLYHPLFKSRRFLRATSDRFFIAIDATDALYDPHQTRTFMESLGGTALEELEE